MAGDARPDMAGVYPLPAESGSELLLWPADLSITGAEGHPSHPEGQMLRVSSAGGRGMAF